MEGSGGGGGFTPSSKLEGVLGQGGERGAAVAHPGNHCASVPLGEGEAVGLAIEHDGS